ncbi:MAG TPA: discoidin domain-containing protein, partial [Paludibacter sp.]|nr:discoidin domain-containing protein [Paludibacter sp.]
MKKLISLTIVLLSLSLSGFSQILLSQGKTCTSSSVEGGNAPKNAVDGSLTTRWASNWAGDINPADAWWQVDLGK